MLAPRVIKSVGDHELCAFAKRSLDLRSPKWLAIAGVTSPEGFSKGQEQQSTFQLVGGSLGSVQHRVLANADGKSSPAPPMSVFVRGSLGMTPRSIEKVLQMIPSVGWTSRQRPSCGGRGWR